MDERIVQVEDLSKTYMQGKIPVTAVHDVTFTISQGELVAIMGPSGSGNFREIHVFTIVLIMPGTLPEFFFEDLGTEDYVIAALKMFFSFEVF